jgi:hypothetical protein
MFKNVILFLTCALCGIIVGGVCPFIVVVFTIMHNGGYFTPVMTVIAETVLVFGGIVGLVVGLWVFVKYFGRTSN